VLDVGADRTSGDLDLPEGDPARQDFHLTSASVAIDKASATYAPARDRDGRTWVAAPDTRYETAITAIDAAGNESYRPDAVAYVTTAACATPQAVAVPGRAVAGRAAAAGRPRAGSGRTAGSGP
jgi:hypothetical protein